jgi:SAM-dependent methyltransferase
MEIENWGIHANLKKEIEEHYKTKYALSLVDADPISIAEKLTFDGFVSSLTIDNLTEFLVTLNTQFLHGGIRGVGLEIGSGPGTFVAALATLPQVTRVYGVEACESIINKLMTKVVGHIAGNNERKVVGAIADFDNLKLPAASVDFVFDFFSPHHSPDPSKTLKEISRVLKPGGVMFCIDKARANSLSPRELDALLEIEYTAKTKKDMGLPIDVKHTRRMNGEHEYRLNDWKEYFADAELSNFKHYNVAKIGGAFIGRLIKKLFALLPINLQSNFSKFFSRKITNNLEPSNRIFTAVLPFYPREFSLMIAWKK